MVASAHPAERIKSISRLKLSEKNIQNSGTSERLKKGGTATFLLSIVQDLLRSSIAFTKRSATCLIASTELLYLVLSSSRHSSFMNTSEFSEDHHKKKYN